MYGTLHQKTSSSCRPRDLANIAACTGLFSLSWLSGTHISEQSFNLVKNFQLQSFFYTFPAPISEVSILYLNIRLLVTVEVYYLLNNRIAYLILVYTISDLFWWTILITSFHSATEQFIPNKQTISQGNLKVPKFDIFFRRTQGSFSLYSQGFGSNSSCATGCVVNQSPNLKCRRSIKYLHLM